jgi:Glycosyltransferase family 87
MKGPRRSRPRIETLAAATAVGIGVAAVWGILWSTAGESASFFGGDIVAYQSAADRLIRTGSPYSAELMAGPIANVAENVQVGYFYPPPLSQLFVPLAGVGRFQIATVYVVLQVLALAVLLPRLVPPESRSGSTALWVAAAVIWSFPMQFALFGGNLSAMLAIGVALSLVAGTAAKSSVAALATIIKLTPAPLLLVALATRANRGSVLTVASVVLAISVALDASAWIEWLAVLPNVLRNEMNHGAFNYSPAAVGEALGWPQLGGLVGLALSASFMLVGLRNALVQATLSLPVLSAAIGSVTFASPTLWDHYFAVLVPLNICGWFVAKSPLLRPLVVALAVVGLGQWFGLNESTWYRAMLLSIVVLNFGLLAKMPRGSGAGSESSRRPADTLPLASAAV